MSNMALGLRVGDALPLSITVVGGSRRRQTTTTVYHPSSSDKAISGLMCQSFSDVASHHWAR